MDGKGVGKLTVKLQPVTCSYFKKLFLYPLLPLTYLLQDGSTVRNAGNDCCFALQTHFDERWQVSARHTEHNAFPVATASE